MLIYIDQNERVHRMPGAAELVQQARGLLDRCTSELEKAIDEPLLEAEAAVLEPG